MGQILIRKLVELEDLVVPSLFKPVQFNILKKLNSRRKLTENEKRYLRGRMKAKLNILNRILSANLKVESYVLFLNNLGSYYITGLEALKHNGFGWYFKTKIIEIINTKINGRINFSDKVLKFIRVKSIKNSGICIDKKTGLKYAKNEQIIKDMKIIKNKYAERVWKQMLSRYGKLFVKNKRLGKVKNIDYKKYGV